VVIQWFDPHRQYHAISQTRDPQRGGRQWAQTVAPPSLKGPGYPVFFFTWTQSLNLVEGGWLTARGYVAVWSPSN
jgi:hypothetical protein